nr:MAG: ORF3 [Torque teno polar bear virus 7]
MHHKHYGLNTNSFLRSLEKAWDSADKDGPSKKQTPVQTVQTETATPVSSRKGILKSRASSQKRRLKELLSLLTPPKKEFWRSSPGLFAENSESESESDGWIFSPEKSPGLPSTAVPNSPTASTRSRVSGIEELDSDDDAFESNSWDLPPLCPFFPAVRLERVVVTTDNEVIYSLLRSLK